MTGKVRWFDNFTGVGVIRADDGTYYKVHYSAIMKSFYEPGQHLTFFHRMLFQGQSVEFTVFNDSHWQQVEEVL